MHNTISSHRHTIHSLHVKIISIHHSSIRTCQKSLCKEYLQLQGFITDRQWSIHKDKQMSVPDLGVSGPDMNLFLRQITLVWNFCRTQVDAHILWNVEVGPALVIIHVFNCRKNKKRQNVWKTILQHLDVFFKAHRIIAVQMSELVRVTVPWRIVFSSAGESSSFFPLFCLLAKISSSSFFSSCKIKMYHNQGYKQQSFMFLDTVTNTKDEQFKVQVHPFEQRGIIWLSEK